MEYVLLRWAFTPTDFFEEKIEFSCDRCKFVVSPGNVEATLECNVQPTQYRELREELHQKLNAAFLGAQIVSRIPYALQKGSLESIDEKGVHHVTAFLESATATLTIGAPDVVVKDASGQIVRDTRKERIDRRVHLAQHAASNVTDPVSQAVLRSYDASINDPRNELIHLYEIRETLAAHFGGEAGTRKALHISGTDWSRLGRLANDEPLLQGRHRGKHPGALRDATPDELKEARGIACSMIESYVTAIKAAP